MDLEHLTKGQIILLTLLVSFMTSIATGIVTVSLMQQMPTPVTQTINRVVERTLERVVEKKTDAQGVTTTKEKTVVVKETDLISNAVQAALPSLVAIYVTEPTPQQKPLVEEQPVDGATQTAAVSSQTVNQETQKVPTTETPVTQKTTKRFLARGVYIADGVIATDAAQIPEIPEGTAVQLSIVLLASGAELPVVSVKTVGQVALLSVAKKSGAVLTAGNAHTLQLGNTLVVLGGEGRVQVSTGIVSNLDRDDKKNVTGLTVDGITPQPGAVLVSLEGHMLAQYIHGAWHLGE